MTDLQKEIQTYKKLLPELLGEEGKYVVIVGEELIGTYAAYEDALKEGYEVAKLEPFLVKKISGTETISYFSRDIDQACHTA
ncbi:MAG: hypothetical protein KDJ35_07065 [Alphaproteobacteria bacterium]|nr:hypothetical protein [Alphaproteobacteria bacterium]